MPLWSRSCTLINDSIFFIFKKYHNFIRQPAECRLELYEGGIHQVQRLFETWIAAIAAVLVAEGMEATVAKQKAEKALILVQGSLILSQGLNDVKIFKRIIGDIVTELLLNRKQLSECRTNRCY